MSKNILLLMMGGSGTRFGADTPKQFVEVNGKPVFSYIVGKYTTLNCIDAMVVVCHALWLDYADDWVKKVVPAAFTYEVTAGGSSRSESIKNGLEAVSKFASAEDVVLIHDATHPYVDEGNLSLVIDATKHHGGATLGERQYDTVYSINAETNLLEKVIPREVVVSGASPEAFLFGKIYEIYANTPLEQLNQYTSAGALALAHEIDMEVVPTNLINLKITYKHDMEVFRKLFHDYYF